MLGPWYVGDTPTSAIVVEVQRNGSRIELDGYASASAWLLDPDGALRPWGSIPSIDNVNDFVMINPPASSPFTRYGTYTLMVQLATPAGATETFEVDTISVLAMTGTVWPPTLDDLKTDVKIDLSDHSQDELLTIVLDAAIRFIERIHRGRFNFSGEMFSTLETPDLDMKLGTCRLAYRWHERRRSPEMLANLGEFGTTRIPSFDADIERMCRIGKQRGMIFA